MNLGDSFWMGNPRGKTKHLWVVISDPKFHRGNCIAVNFTKDEMRACGECLTLKNEHPSLTEAKSWVTFGDVLEITLETQKHFWMLSQLNPSGFVMAAVAPTACVNKLIAAAKVSSAFPLVMLKYLT